MKVEGMHACIRAVLLKVAPKHIGLKAVGMAGRCWMTKEINDKLKERQEVCRSGGIHTESHKSLNIKVSHLTAEVKPGLWQHKVLEAKGTSEMWQVMKSHTDNKPNNNNTHIITDNGRAYVSQRQKANALMNMYQSVS